MTDDFQNYVIQAFEYAVEMEQEWTTSILSSIEGIDVEEMLDFIKYRANKMLNMIGLPVLYPGHEENNMLWIRAYLDEFTGIKTDFFEAQNASYKKVGSGNQIEDAFDDEDWD